MKTVSLELSKQLKEAGYPQEGFIYWSKKGEIFSPIFPENNMYVECIAPTCDEILDLLPKSIQFLDKPGNPKNWLMDAHRLTENEKSKMRIVGLLDIQKPTDWIVLYSGYMIFGLDMKARTHGDSLADAAAKMWLYLKKENLL